MIEQGPHELVCSRRLLPGDLGGPLPLTAAPPHPSFSPHRRPSFTPKARCSARKTTAAGGESSAAHISHGSGREGVSSVYSRSAGRCAARRSGRKDGGGGGARHCASLHPSPPLRARLPWHRHRRAGAGLPLPRAPSCRSRR